MPLDEKTSLQVFGVISIGVSLYLNRSIINGPESFTPDNNALMGEHPDVEGLFLNCGMCSRGVQMSAGYGSELANIVVDGAPSVDLFGYDIKRLPRALIGNDKWLRERCHETMVHVKKTDSVYVLRFKN